MITVEEAKDLVHKYSQNNTIHTVQLGDSFGCTLAKSVYAPISLPPFAQSAMDGYAIRFEDLSVGNSFTLQGESKAGANTNELIKAQHCVRIFTGAPTPLNATAVVIQERASVFGDQIQFDTTNLKEFSNIRPIGEQINADQLALPAGTLLNAGSIGFLASLGISEIDVYTTPRIAIIVTGDELTQAGNPLDFGKIYESNSITLQCALQETGFNKFALEFIKDDFETTVNKIEELQNNYDYLIFTGGISVGDYDFTGKALEKLGAECFFYKVKQKPGKPLYFGKLNNTYVFGLPGNPAAALTCYYQYVFPSLQKYMGKTKTGLHKIELPLCHDFTQKSGRAQFLKAKFNTTAVTILGSQASSMLASFTEANCLVYITSDNKVYKKTDLVEVHVLPS